MGPDRTGRNTGPNILHEVSKVPSIMVRNAPSIMQSEQGASTGG